MNTKATGGRNVGCSALLGAGQMKIGAVMVESGTPTAYRLARSSVGELVLQGAFQWNEGAAGGFEWRDIPTVDLPPNTEVNARGAAASLVERPVGQDEV